MPPDRARSPRRHNAQLRVSAELAGRRTAALVVAGLLALAAVTVALALAAVTVALALAANADGARHPATSASVIVAVIVVLGGPRLLDAVRRRAARSVGR